jgi:phage-related protein
MNVRVPDRDQEIQFFLDGSRRIARFLRAHPGVRACRWRARTTLLALAGVGAA